MKNTPPPTKAEYYNEDYSSISSEDRLDLFSLESREACGLLWNAVRHIRNDNPEAAHILNVLRDDLITDMEENGEESWAACNKTLFLYRRNTVGILPNTIFKS